ncbi:MAG TPA: ATP-binding protein [Fimbriimonadaceae bacterium]
MNGLEGRRWSAETAHMHLLDMETGVRGFLLGDSKFLEPYKKADLLVHDDLQNLVTISSGHPMGKLAAKIKQDSDAWMDAATEMVSTREAGRPLNAALLISGKNQFDTVRIDFKSYIDHESARIEDENTLAQSLKVRLMYIALFGGILLAMLLAFITFNHLRVVSALYHRALVANELKAAHIVEMNTELEARVSERTTELSNANKELEAFSYSVSHDLRSPLRSIASFSMILQQDLGEKLDEDSKDNLSRIRQAASRMTELIDALLRFSRIARVHVARSEVDVSAMAESVFTDLQRDSKSNVEHTVQPGMTAEADPHLLRVALENILENAWKFSSKVEQPKIEMGFQDGAFFVKDNGAGFEEEYVHKIFLPFERLHKETEFSGTGIGLATTKRIIDRHGGKIWAESKVGHGATFHFTLSPEEKWNSEA